MLVLPENDPALPLKKRDILFGKADDRGARFPVQEFFDNLAFHGGFDNPRHVFHLEFRIQIIPRFDDDEGVHFTEAKTSGDAEGELVMQILLQYLTFDDPDQIVRAAGLTPGSPADDEAWLPLVFGVHNGFTIRLEFGNSLKSIHFISLYRSYVMLV